MPINAYVGLMGSGKSFEVVSTVILDALANGRDVVTNVDGIDSDACRAYLVEKRSLELAKLGVIRHCTNDDVLLSTFLPHGESVTVASTAPGPNSRAVATSVKSTGEVKETFVRPGDLVCIDEAWRFWGTDCKILPEHFIFFREHRHYAHPLTKVTCDLVLMVQDIADLNRKLKLVVELSFRTHKIKSLGMTKTYRIEMWEGYALTAKKRVSVEVKKYNPDIFPLYSSYAGGTGTEVQVDKRQNLLNSTKLWVIVFLLICSFVLGFFLLSRFFGAGKKKQDAAKSASVASSASGSPVPAGVGLTGSASVPDRLLGTYTVGGVRYGLVASGYIYRPQSALTVIHDGMQQVVQDGVKSIPRFDMTHAVVKDSK